MVLELDGAVFDLHMEGHREAFNLAFRDLGYACTNWPPVVYSDLLAAGDGTAEGLVKAYYDAVGWPIFVPTNEQHIFKAKVHETKRKMLAKMLAAGEVPLREGLVQVIDDALAAGARVALLPETQSTPEDGVLDSAFKALGEERAARLAVLQPAADGGTTEVSSSLQAAIARSKQQGAQAFVEAMGGTGSEQQQSAVPGRVGVEVHSSLLVPGAGRSPVSPAYLQAAALLLGVAPSRCLSVAASAALLQAASDAGMVAVALPRRLGAAITFPSARAKFEGYGVGGASWSRLVGLLPPPAAEAPGAQPAAG